MDSRQNWIVIAWALSAFIGGCAKQYFEPGIQFSLTYKILTAVTAMLVFSWYYLDSNNINYKRGIFLNTSVIGLTLFALPYYFFRSRGLKVGALYTTLFIVAVAVWFGVGTAGSYVIYHVIQS
mgnify:CR=1 FL=1